MTTEALLVGGHECRGRCGVVTPGRQLQRAVGEALAEQPTVVVVPMTFGRDPAMVADTAKTLQWLALSAPGRIALAAPFGTPDHLVALLRGAARRAQEVDPDVGLIVAAATSNPFDDAELHRLAHLVRVHGAGIEVEVALLREDRDVLTANERLRLLGVPRRVVVPAGFGTGPSFTDDPDLTSLGQLLGEAAIARVVAARVDEARHLLADHHDDGISRGLMADHDHGYAHSHHHAHDHAEEHHHGHEEAALRVGRR